MAQIRWHEQDVKEVNTCKNGCIWIILSNHFGSFDSQERIAEAYTEFNDKTLLKLSHTLLTWEGEPRKKDA